jgi:hypothetical protein
LVVKTEKKDAFIVSEGQTKELKKQNSNDIITQTAHVLEIYIQRLLQETELYNKRTDLGLLLSLRKNLLVLQ